MDFNLVLTSLLHYLIGIVMMRSFPVTSFSCPLIFFTSITNRSPGLADFLNGARAKEFPAGVALWAKEGSALVIVEPVDSIATTVEDRAGPAADQSR